MDYEVDVRKLALFNEMAEEGATTVSDHLNRLSGLHTEIEVSKISFLDMDDVRTHLGDREQVGISVQLTEAPYEYVLFMLEPTGSKRLARGWSATWTAPTPPTAASPTSNARRCRRSATS